MLTICSIFLIFCFLKKLSLPLGLFAFASVIYMIVSAFSFDFDSFGVAYMNYAIGRWAKCYIYFQNCNIVSWLLYSNTEDHVALGESTLFTSLLVNHMTFISLDSACALEAKNVGGGFNQLKVGLILLSNWVFTQFPGFFFLYNLFFTFDSHTIFLSCILKSLKSYKSLQKLGRCISFG